MGWGAVAPLVVERMRLAFTYPVNRVGSLAESPCHAFCGTGQNGWAEQLLRALWFDDSAAWPGLSEWLGLPAGNQAPSGECSTAMSSERIPRCAATVPPNGLVRLKTRDSIRVHPGLGPQRGHGKASRHYRTPCARKMICAIEHCKPSLDAVGVDTKSACPRM